MEIVFARGSSTAIITRRTPCMHVWNVGASQRHNDCVFCCEAEEVEDWCSAAFWGEDPGSGESSMASYSFDRLESSIMRVSPVGIACCWWGWKVSEVSFYYCLFMLPVIFVISFQAQKGTGDLVQSDWTCCMCWFLPMKNFAYLFFFRGVQSTKSTGCEISPSAQWDFEKIKG